MNGLTDLALYRRGMSTAVASWRAIAAATPNATVTSPPGVSAAVFPTGPERGVYNNAFLDVGLDEAGRKDAVEAMQHAYADAGIDRYAAWVHENDRALQALLRAGGFDIDTTTLAMGMAVCDLTPVASDAEVRSAPWRDHVRLLELSDGLLAGVNPTGFHVLTATLDSVEVATGIGLDHDSDCGVYNVTTVESARRRGIGADLTAQLVARATSRGCTTATLQSTAMAERVYANVGFRPVGRILEFVPTP